MRVVPIFSYPFGGFPALKPGGGFGFILVLPAPPLPPLGIAISSLVYVVCRVRRLRGQIEASAPVEMAHRSGTGGEGRERPVLKYYAQAWP